MKQLINPTPIIPATGGWCLQYVRQAFGLPARYGSATEAWEKSTSKHRDRNFPPNMWVPVWYGIDVEPLGHVVLLNSATGQVYSTSDYSGWPRIHPSLADLEAFYAYYGMILQYRGWTEDVAGYAVMAPEITVQATPTPKPTTTPKDWFDLATKEDLRAVIREENPWAYKNVDIEKADAYAILRAARTFAVKAAADAAATRELVTQMAKNPGAPIDYSKIEAVVKAAIAADMEFDATLTVKKAVQ